jgi:ABC-type sugar transport system permease subunit
MIGPAAGLIGVFVLLPMTLTIWLSFHQWSSQTPFSAAEFVGMRNYHDIFGPISVGRDFKRAFANTALYTGLSVLVLLPLSVLLGLLVHQTRASGGQTLRTVLFATYMVPMIAVALVWSKLYSLVVLNIWQQVGYFTVLAVAGLTQIPTTLYEAARVDGANSVQSFFGVTLPLLRRTLLFSTVIAIINAVQVFEPVALITQGGPAGSTNVLTFHIRRVGIERAQGGIGSAMAVTLMLALLVAILVVFALNRRGEEK